MNLQKLTQRDLKSNRAHSTLQSLLLVLFTPLLAAPGLGQVTKSESPGDDSQTQVQRKTLPAIDFERLLSDKQDKDKDQRNQTRFTSSLFTRTEATDSSSVSTPQTDPDLSKFAVFADAGVAVPHGDLSAFLDPGFSFNAGLEYMITTQFSAEGIFGYHRFSTFFGGDTNVYQLSVNGKFYLVDESNKFRPFVNGGVGAYVTDSATTHFGGNVGGGVLYEVTPHFGITGKYNFHIFSAGSGVKYSTVQAGVRFRF